MEKKVKALANQIETQAKKEKTNYKKATKRGANNSQEVHHCLLPLMSCSGRIRREDSRIESEARISVGLLATLSRTPTLKMA